MLCVVLALMLALSSSGLAEALLPMSEPVELPPEELELELSPTGETSQPGEDDAAGLLVMAAEDEAALEDELAALDAASAVVEDEGAGISSSP